MTEIYVLQLHEADGRTSTRGVTLSQTVAENWVAELPHWSPVELYEGFEWRSYEVFTLMELTDED